VPAVAASAEDGTIAALDGLADCGKRWAGRGWANPTEASSLAGNITAIRVAAFRSAPPQEAPIRSENVGAMTRMILYGGVILAGLLMRRWYGGEITIGSFAMTVAATLAKPGLAVHRSRKMVPAFRLRRQRSAAEAVAMQSESGDGAVFMAGGIDLINRMKFGEPVAEVIYLGGLTELCTITETERGLRLGTLVTHYQLETSAPVRTHFPELTQTWHDVANIRIRCKRYDRRQYHGR
jgi:xanthine dehydrogenase iron-sulfur cluster and FAD-binding subunit A